MNFEPVLNGNGDVELLPENIAFIAHLIGWEEHSVGGKRFVVTPPSRLTGAKQSYGASSEDCWLRINQNDVLNDDDGANLCIKYMTANKRGKIIEERSPFLGGPARIRVELNHLTLEGELPVNNVKIMSFAGQTYNEAVFKAFIASAIIIRESAETIQKLQFAVFTNSIPTTIGEITVDDETNAG